MVILNQSISYHICLLEIFIIFKGQTSNSAPRNIVDIFPLVATRARALAGSLELLAAAPLLLGGFLIRHPQHVGFGPQFPISMFGKMLSVSVQEVA